MPEEGKSSREDLNGADRSRERSFDELAKGLANNTITRRQAFKWFGGAILGGALASIPGVAALAQTSPQTPPQTPPTLPPQASPKAQQATAGCNPPCSLGQTCCSGSCVDLQTSASNCGACSHTCGASEVCTAGTCGCATGTLGDRNNCGACGHACLQPPLGDEACVNGTCIQQCGLFGHNCAESIPGHCVCKQGQVCAGQAEGGGFFGSCVEPCTTTCPQGQLCSGNNCYCSMDVGGCGPGTNCVCEPFTTCGANSPGTCT